MEIRVVDFDILTKNFKNYQDGIKGLNDLKSSFVKRIDPIKTEMESIIKAANSGLILDPKSQQEKSQKFQELQDEAMSIDNEFKVEMRKAQDELNKKTYDELSAEIEAWSNGKGIDMIMGKMEVVWCGSAIDITNDILDALKSKGLYVDHVEQAENPENEGTEVIIEEL